MTLIISSQHAVRESSLCELVCASDSCNWLGGVRGRGKRHFDQKEGRKDQPPLTAASMLIKISLCRRLDSARGGCWFKCKSWNKTLATGSLKQWEVALSLFPFVWESQGRESGSGGWLGAESAPPGLCQLFPAPCCLAEAKPWPGPGPNSCVLASLCCGWIFLSACRKATWHLPLDTQSGCVS